MSYTLNTSHALYGNLIELIGVQSGALVSHKTARTFTKHADATYGTGAYGEHFNVVGVGYTDKGASFTPALGVATTTIQNYTVVTVLNASGLNGGSASLTGTVSPRVAGAGLASGVIKGYRGVDLGVTALGAGARMLTRCRVGETAEKLYYDAGVIDYNATGLSADYNDPAASANYIGGNGSGSNCNLSIVWIAVFNKELSSGEISDLFASLGASNAFGLISSGSSTNLVLSDALQSHSPDNLTLTTTSGVNLIVNDATQSHAPDNNVFTLGYVLVIAEALHSNATDNLTINVTGRITIPACKDWETGNLKLNQSGVQVDVHDISTGELVVRLTNQTTHATTGVCTVTHAALSIGTTYEVVTRFADGSKGMWDYLTS